VGKEGELAGGLEGVGGGGVEAGEELDEEKDEELEKLERKESEELELEGLEAGDDGPRPSERPGRPTEDELLDWLFGEAGGEEVEGDGLDGGGSLAAPTTPPSPPPSKSTGTRFRSMRFTSA